VFEHNNDNKVITFLGVEYSSNETLHQHLKMLSLMNIKNVNWLLTIALLGTEIDNIVNDAKQIPS